MRNALIATLFLLVGCVLPPPITGPTFSEIQDKLAVAPNEAGLVIMYVDTYSMAGNFVARAQVNGGAPSLLASKAFVFQKVRPGLAHVVVDHPIDPGAMTVTLDMSPGKTRYLYVDSSRSYTAATIFGGLIGAAAHGGGPFNVRELPEQEALARLPEFRHQYPL